MTFTVFISSSVRDMQIIRELKETLERYGITSVLSPDTFPPSVSIEQTISQQIQASDCVLVIIGRYGERSETLNSELGLATRLNRRIIPIVEEGAEIPENLHGREYILMDSNQPRLSYVHAAQYLSRLKVEKETRNIIGGLLLLGLGVLLLGALTSD